MNRPLRSGILAALAVLVVIAAAIAGSWPLAPRVALSLLAEASGRRFESQHFALSLHHVTIQGLRISTPAHETIVAADRVDVEYRLRDLLFGGPRLFGLVALDLERPQIRLVHRRDGTWNVPIPQQNGGPANPRAALDAKMRVRGGSIALHDETRRYSDARDLAIDDIEVRAQFHPRAPSRYRVQATLVAAGGRYPLRGAGALDDSHGWERQRWTAARLPVAPLVDYAVNAPSLHALGGVLAGVDVVVAGLSDAGGVLDRHVFAGAGLSGGRLQLAGIAAPIDRLHGTFYATNQTLLTQRASATLAGVPLRIAGGVYDLSEPKLRLGVRAEGSVSQLLHAAPPAAELPIRGRIALRVLVEGDARQPLTIANVTGRDIRYAAMAVDGLAADVALQGTNATIVRASGIYAEMHAVVRGNVALGKEPQPALLVGVDAPAHSLPLVDRIAPGLPLHALALVGGSGTRLGGRGVLTGATRSASLAATFDVDPNGNGRIGPLTLDGPQGHYLYARATLEHGLRMTQVVALARGVELRDAPDRSLPGLNLPHVPSAGGTVDAALVGEVAGTKPWFGAGRVVVRKARYSGIALDDVHADGVASAGVVALSSLSVHAPWGRFEGTGSAHGSATAVSGRFTGDLAAVGVLVGQQGLNGSADVPLRVLNTPHGTLAQVTGARFAGASVNGVPLDALDATVRLRGSAVDVYAADANLRGGRVVAAGSIGNGGSLSVSAGDVPLSAVSGVPAALRGGSISGGGAVAGTQASPSVVGDAVLSGASLRGLPFMAATHATFSAGRLALRDASAVAAGAVASADGGVTGLTRRSAPAYALHATVLGADVPTLVRAVGRSLPLPFTGAANANLAIRGSGTEPAISGRVSLGAGSVNGLAFRDAVADISTRGSSAQVRSGSVTVGSTRLALSGAFAPSELSGRVRAPHVDLADFDDFFDDGDQLAGRGSASLAFSRAGDRVQTNGRIALEGARYQRFRLGSARAAWTSSGRRIAASASISSASGKVALNGSALVPAGDPLRNPIDRFPLDIQAVASGVDLATWLPAAGVYAPITGRLDAQARLAGPIGSSTATASLRAHDAAIGRLDVRRADVTLHAARGRVTIPAAVVELPSLLANANGSFGFHPRDPVALSASLSSPDVGALVKGVSGKTIDAAGALSSQLRITGSLLLPRVEDTLDLANARYAALSIPRAHARLTLEKGAASLDEASVDFARGALRAALHAPLDVRHPALRPDEPFTGMLQADHVDLANFGPLLGEGTTMKGTLDGRIDVAGTPRHPATTGVLALSGGYYASPQLPSPLTDVSGRLAVQSATLQLTALHANVGRGSIDGGAVASIGDLRDPARTLGIRGSLRASQAEINAPNYLRGTVDGEIAVAREPRGPVRVSGNVSLPHARIPLAALYNPRARPSSSAAPLPVAFDLGVDVGRDVRIQSGQIDVGGQGSLHVGGTLAAPQLAGTLRSTGGTVDFYRNFRLTEGSVRFDPRNGLMPFVRAVAMVRVPDPSTDVTLTVSGLAPNGLNVTLDSDPPYERSQILGLLLGAQQLGAVSGVASTSGNAPTAGQLAASFAQSSLSQQFTRQLLEPLSAQLGQTFGLNQFAINYDPSGGFQANARKGLARNVDAVYAETFNYPVRKSLGIEAHPTPGTSLQLTFFQQQGTGQFSPVIYSSSTNPALTATQPAAGTSGFSFTVQRRFWGGKRKPPPSPAPLAPTPTEAAAR